MTDLRNLPPIDSLEEFESIKLFIDRSMTNQPDLELTDVNKEPIAKICYRLDGIPLAIELAAARMKLMGPQDILNRLDNRFQLLTGGSRSALERHKTLRATLDWSYELLTENEKILFNRLSVFAGGCNLKAVEIVCAFDTIDPLETLDLTENPSLNPCARVYSGSCLQELRFTLKNVPPKLKLHELVAGISVMQRMKEYGFTHVTLTQSYQDYEKLCEEWFIDKHDWQTFYRHLTPYQKNQLLLEKQEGDYLRFYLMEVPNLSVSSILDNLRLQLRTKLK